MSRVVVTARNDQLGRLALGAARAAGRHTIERRAALCASIALTTTGTIRAAGEALGHLDAIGRPDIQAAAAALIHKLATQEATREP